MCVCPCTCMCTSEFKYPERPEKGVEFLGAEVMGCFEPSDVDTEN